MTIWGENVKSILVQFGNGYFCLSFGLLGRTLTMFECSPVILSPFKVTKCLYCDAGPHSNLSVFVSIILPLYGRISLVHTHSCIQSTHTDIIHACLRCQCCFNYTESVIHNVIQNVTNRVYLKWQTPRQPFTSVFSFPQFSHYLSKDNWQYFLSYVDCVSFRMLVFIPVKVNDGIFFRMLTVFFFRMLTVFFFRMLTVFSFVCWRYFLSYVGLYPIKVNDSIFFRMLTVFPFVCWSLFQYK